MEIRIYKNTDLLNVATLFLKVFNSDPWNDNWESTEQVKENLSDIINSPKFIGFVAIKKDKIVGFVLGNIKIWSTAKHYYLSEMCIDNDMQRSGVGTKLISSLKSYLKKLDVSELTLLTIKDMFSYNFYIKNNFEEVEDLKFLTTSI